jgi:hypothetical protein
MNTLEQLRSGQLTGARDIKIACGLSEFPREIFALADTLEVLDLSGNALSALPDDFAQLHKLRIFFASDNAFTEVPEVLGQCQALSMVGFKANRIRQLSGQALPAQLRWLILTDNAMTALPAEIGRCTQLQKLMLAGNQLSALPPELAACHKLELLRVSANRLTALPEWLLRMPRLTWLACGGNPFGETAEAQALQHSPIAHIAWSDLEMQQQLGQGASGVIQQALLNTPQGLLPVAVKLFKGAVTSDRLPARGHTPTADPRAGPNHWPSGGHSRFGHAFDRSAHAQPGWATQHGLMHPRHLCRDHAFHAERCIATGPWHRIGREVLAPARRHAR